MKAVILIEPEIPENTGFIARLADNYSVELRIVNPKFQLEEARKTATNAQEKLRETTIYETVEQALEGLEHVVGTKPGRGISVKQFQPRENTSVMIGRESSGLSNEELDLCDAVVHLDVPGYDSVNQSHATAIFLHELSEGTSHSLDEGQKKALESFIGDGILQELILRASPEEGDFDHLMGELKQLDN